MSCSVHQLRASAPGAAAPLWLMSSRQPSRFDEAAFRCEQKQRPRLPNFSPREELKDPSAPLAAATASQPPLMSSSCESLHNARTACCVLSFQLQGPSARHTNNGFLPARQSHADRAGIGSRFSVTMPSASQSTRPRHTAGLSRARRAASGRTPRPRRLLISRWRGRRPPPPRSRRVSTLSAEVRQRW